jgi:hypothetical protein
MTHRNKHNNIKGKNTMRIEKPIIFIGTGRSGTTVISEIIMRHRKLAFPSNFQQVFFMIPEINLIRNIFDNKLWRIHGQKKQLNKVNILNRYIFRQNEAYKMWEYITGDGTDFSRSFLINKRENNERINHIHGYFQKMIKYQNRERLTFKITGPSRMEYLLSIFPDAYFIVLKRKPIPTISSFLKVNFWKSRGLKQLWWSGVYSDKEKKWVNEHKGDPLWLTTFQIKKIYDITEMECKKCKPKYIEVNYEDFVKKPREEILRILDFVNLDVDNACLSYLKENRIYNRNRPDSEYFNEEELEKINHILNID